MKRHTEKRGLHVQETVTTETRQELGEALDAVAADLERYVNDAAEAAGSILREAGIDPDTLWDRVMQDGRWTIRAKLLDRDRWPDVVGQALDVLWHVHYSARPKLADPVAREGIWAGVHLAQAIEHLMANLSWEKPVRGYFASRRRSKYKDLVRAKAEELKQRGVTRGLKAHVARALQLEGIKISDRQVRDLLS